MTKRIGEALKNRDEVRLSTFRLLSSAFNYEFIAKQHKLSEEEELVVVRHEAKKRKEAIEALRQASAKGGQAGLAEKIKDRIEREEKELKILEEFLPAQISDEELGKIVEEATAQTGAKTMADIGKTMGVAMAKVAGRADGTRVLEIVKLKLTHD